MKKRAKRPAKKPLPRKRKKESVLVRSLREQIRFYSREYQFLKGKCERLELALLGSRPGAPSAYVARTDEADRPPIEDAAVKKLDFRTLRTEWDKLSAAQQEEHLKKHDWEPTKSKGTN
jgi:hypothetical protein